MSEIVMNKINFVNNSLPAINDTNLNAMQDNAETAINEVQSNLDDTLEVTTGIGSINTTYASDIENNHWERVGKIVSYAFTIRATGTWGQTTTFVTGLPKPVANTRFSGINSSGNVPFRCILGTDGTISNAYSFTTPTNNQVLEGQITYITSE